MSETTKSTETLTGRARSLANLKSGRKLGSRNRIPHTRAEVIQCLWDRQVGKLGRWLQEIYERNGPQAAFDSALKLAEYAIPKLARQEITGEDHGPLEIRVSWKMPDTHAVIDITPTASASLPNNGATHGKASAINESRFTECPLGETEGGATPTGLERYGPGRRPQD